MTLEELGWTPAREAQLAALGHPDYVAGRVALEHNHVYRVLTAEAELLAESSGRLKHSAAGRRELPAVGDWVALRPEPGGRALIRAILPRTSWFSRKAAGRDTKEQVVAANLDVVLVVFGLDVPVKTRAIERYLVLARRSGAVPIVILNKADASDDVDAALAEARAIASDTAVLAISAREDVGLDPLRRELVTGRTLALLGPSGAGKSSIVNRLISQPMLPTGDVREWDSRGRHTSVHRQLVAAEFGGLIIDTPGMRELQLWDVDEAIDETFADVTGFAAGCRFRDCRHDREPGCAVKAAVDDGRLDAERYGHYLQLQQERLDLDQLREVKERLNARKERR